MLPPSQRSSLENLKKRINVLLYDKFNSRIVSLTSFVILHTKYIIIVLIGVFISIFASQLNAPQG